MKQYHWIVMLTPQSSPSKWDSTRPVFLDQFVIFFSCCCTAVLKVTSPVPYSCHFPYCSTARKSALWKGSVVETSGAKTQLTYCLWHTVLWSQTGISISCSRVLEIRQWVQTNKEPEGRLHIWLWKSSSGQVLNQASWKSILFLRGRAGFMFCPAHSFRERGLDSP